MKIVVPATRLYERISADDDGELKMDELLHELLLLAAHDDMSNNWAIFSSLMRRALKKVRNG